MVNLSNLFVLVDERPKNKFFTEICFGSSPCNETPETTVNVRQPITGKFVAIRKENMAKIEKWS